MGNLHVSPEYFPSLYGEILAFYLTLYNTSKLNEIVPNPTQITIKHDTLSNSFHLATGTLCIRNKGYTRLHTLNTLRAPKQAVFTWLHQNIERGAVRSCEHIFDGLRRRRFLTVTKSIQSMREGNLLPREGKRGGRGGKGVVGFVKSPLQNK